MNRQVTILALTLLVISIGSAAFTQTACDDELLSNFNVEAGNSAAYLPVPFHYQNNNYYCGPAALEMVFDYYGEDIPQTEIADVARTYPYVTYTDELRRAAHFSNLSTSLGDEMSGNITGYSARMIGYAAFEQWGLTTDDLKTLINKGEPLIVLMWWTPSKVYGHYRVVIGYNETHIIMHDPWNRHFWGGSYGGANTSMAYSTFLDLWEYIGYWGLWVHPWNVELQTPITANKGDKFEVMANITYPCSAPFDTGEYPVSSCKATIELQEGLKLAPEETIQHSLGDIIPENSVQTSWSVHSMEIGLRNISVTVTGIVEGNVGTHETYPFYNYMDKIGGLCFDSLLVSNQTYAVHNLDTGLDYATIQEAIDAPETLDGHTIFAEAGIYYEHITVYKSLSLIGANRSNTTIDGNNIGKVVRVTADDTEIRGFTIQKAGFTPWGSDTGIYVKSSNNVITDNIIVDNDDWAIWLDSSSSNNTITFNTITNNWRGCMLKDTSGNTLVENDITNHGQDGICLWNSSQNVISNNNISDNVDGLAFTSSHSNNVTGNNITNNLHGVSVDSSSSNEFYHNNFIHNDQQAYFFTLGGTNSWDNGVEGNYWSNYTGVDLNHDGIGDTLHVIDSSNIDNCPLMGTFSSFNVSQRFGEGLSVTTISNSTIYNFNVAKIIPIPINVAASGSYSWNQTGETRVIFFNITGDTGLGFCRMCIPKALMCPPYMVLLNRGPGSPVYYNETLFDNCTHRWIYFNYPQSLINEVWIIGKEDIAAPLIANVTQQPDEENVYPDDKVEVYANITDELSGVKQVILNYTTSNGTWFSKEMTNLDSDIWNATIPPFPYQTNVTYIISAEDNVDNYITTEGTVYECQYQVIPEFPSFLTLPIFVITTLLAVIVYRINLSFFHKP